MADEVKIHYVTVANKKVGIVETKSLQKIFELCMKAARSNITVLFCGETGTGKGLLARLIYKYSLRAMQGPFVDFNCSEVPPELLADALFGHLKGSYTDAYETTIGVVKKADKGFLFIDEVESIDLNLQCVLLKVIDTHEYKPIGSSKTEISDFRPIFATNKDLHKLIKQGLFREDFFQRINGLMIIIPPLRERITDIQPLSRFFLDQLKMEKVNFTDAAFNRLLNYYWPGNHRELSKVIEVSSLMLDGDDFIEPVHLPVYIDNTGEEDIFASGILPMNTSVKMYKKARTRFILDLYEGDHKKAAQLLQESDDSISRALKY